MFSPDVVSLRQFYHTPLGERAWSLIDRALKTLWPQANGDTVLAIGYGAPYLGRFCHQAATLMVAMPAAQGAAYWAPDETSGANVVMMAHESELPLRESSINRVLLIHSLEHSESLSWMMDEIWRVLTPGGRVLAVVPNRRGCWSRSSRSPFGHGRPFSPTQLRDLLEQHQFTPTRNCSALFLPPTRLNILWKIAPRLDSLCQFLRLHIGGVLLVEAEKQIYASIKQPVHVRKLYGMPIPAAQTVSTKNKA